MNDSIEQAGFCQSEKIEITSASTMLLLKNQIRKLKNSR